MIVERQVIAPRTLTANRVKSASFGEGLAARPAVAGRERLAEALGESLVIQLMLVMSLVVFAALIYLNQASKVSILQYKISDLSAQQSMLRQENAQLTAIKTKLILPGRIDSIATTQLHMVKTDFSSIHWVTVKVPVVHPVKPLGADLTAAEARSQPQAWVHRFVGFVESSL
jgi:cell division protein FtsL